MASINGWEFVILILVALVVLGPERLPQYAAQLARLVRELRVFATRAREQVRAEMGEDFDDVDWQALDPRRYDPRRIVREALLDGDDDPLGIRDDPLGLQDGRDGAAGGRNGRASRATDHTVATAVTDEVADREQDGEADRRPGQAPGGVRHAFDADAT
ncbi:MAG: hypothetical protein ACRC35_01820 [Angustibacter sp.]